MPYNGSQNFIKQGTQVFRFKINSPQCKYKSIFKMQYIYFATQARQLTTFLIISFPSQNRKDDFGKSKGRFLSLIC